MLLFFLPTNHLCSGLVPLWFYRVMEWNICHSKGDSGGLGTISFCILKYFLISTFWFFISYSSEFSEISGICNPPLVPPLIFKMSLSIHVLQLKGDALRCIFSSCQLSDFVQGSSPFDFIVYWNWIFSIPRGIQGDWEQFSIYVLKYFLISPFRFLISWLLWLALFFMVYDELPNLTSNCLFVFLFHRIDRFYPFLFDVILNRRIGNEYWHIKTIPSSACNWHPEFIFLTICENIIYTLIVLHERIAR